MILRRFLILFIIAFLFCSLNTKSNCQDEEIVLWSSNRKLSWDDFKGEVDTTQINYGAMTSTRYDLIDSYYENDIPVYKLGCYFIKDKSWSRVDDPESLAHEQLHFDITELYVRKMRRASDSLNKKKVKDANVYVKIFQFYGRQLSNYQESYDNDVYFTENRLLYWQKKIAAELLKLKKWEYIPEK